MLQPNPDAEKHEGPLRKALSLIRASATDRARGGKLSTGELAQLRRPDDGGVGSPALWRVLAELFPKELHENWIRDRLPDWSCALAAFAELAQESSGRPMPLGEALGMSDFSEMRLLRLLRAPTPELYREVRGAAHFLAQKGVPADPLELGRLVIGEPGQQAQQLRRRIAQSYYRALHKKPDATHASPKES